MSNWHEIKKEDISIDEEKDGVKVNIPVFQDNSGMNWAEIKLDDIKDKIKEYENGRNKNQ